MNRKLSIVPALFAFISACMSAPQHQADVRAASEAGLTVGVVQREIHAGMTGADVAAVLGAPNIVTSGPDRSETWIYDRVASETVYSTSSGGVAALILGGTGSAGGGAGGNIGRSAGASAHSQRTLTVVVNLGPDSRVRDFSYHASQF